MNSLPMALVFDGDGVAEQLALHALEVRLGTRILLPEDVHAADVVVVGPAIAGPVTLAQQAHALDPNLPVVLIASDDEAESLRQSLRFAPLIGRDVVCLPRSADVAGAAAAAAERGRLQRRNRTVLDAAISQQTEGDQVGPPHPAPFLATLLRRAPLGIVTTSPAGLVTTANAAACDLLGIPERSLLGQALTDVLAVGEPLAESVATVMTLAGPPRRVVEATRWTLGEGASEQTSMVLLRDITEQRHAEQDRLRAETALSHSEARFRAGFVTAPTGMAITTLDGRVVEANEAFSRLAGTSTDELTGTYVYGLFAPETRAAVAETLRRIATGEATASSGERQLHESAGTPGGWVHMSVVAFDDALDRRLLIQLTDVTARRLSEEALIRAYQREHDAAAELRELDELKNGFISAVSHELRTPLSVLRGLSETLDLHLERLTEDESHRLLRRMTFQADRLNRLIVDLLDLGRAQRGILEPEPAPTDVSVVVREVLDARVVTSHEVVLELAPDLTGLMVDGSWVERIADNFVGNAVRYAPPGTPITIAAWLEDELLHLSVRDRGPGVADDHKDRVFEAFRQGPDGDPSGTGVGLSIVRRFADLHGGRAWVEDAEGGGAVFHATLRCAPGDAPAPGSE